MRIHYQRAALSKTGGQLRLGDFFSPAHYCSTVGRRRHRRMKIVGRTCHKVRDMPCHGALGADATHPHFSCLDDINTLYFACPDAPPYALPSTTPTSWLDHFIAYALHRTRLHASVTFTALYLLLRLRPQGLKARFPAAKGSSGHRLFISAFMLMPFTVRSFTRP
jgi:hypothetical protein